MEDFDSFLGRLERDLASISVPAMRLCLLKVEMRTGHSISNPGTRVSRVGPRCTPRTALEIVNLDSTTETRRTYG
jgi:hypothetical protein